MGDKCPLTGLRRSTHCGGENGFVLSEQLWYSLSDEVRAGLRSDVRRYTLNQIADSISYKSKLCGLIFTIMEILLQNHLDRMRLGEFDGQKLRRHLKKTIAIAGSCLSGRHRAFFFALLGRRICEALGLENGWRFPHRVQSRACLLYTSPSPRDRG